MVEDENREEEEEEEGEEYDRINSPVPPPPVEDGDQMDPEEAQSGILHSELGMPHVFKVPCCAVYKRKKIPILKITNSPSYYSLLPSYNTAQLPHHSVLVLLIV